jgi:ubiquinone/menaquinone biosynthesis C-methylase UbiE
MRGAFPPSSIATPLAEGKENAMSQPQKVSQSIGSSPAENYERFFVPHIGAPVAADLVIRANLQPGERVLDVACGTGVVSRLAAERVGTAGSVTGLDIHPGMLAVAAAVTPPDMAIDWREGDAESMPFEDGEFDVVLCQMGLQFPSGKLAALREMRRVLKSGGRALVSVPGPKPPLFEILTEGLARHFGSQAAGFVDRVFSMHDVNELTELMRGAGFRDVEVESQPKDLRMPPPVDFLWQYIYSTPLAQAAGQASQEQRDALERDICGRWQAFVENGSMPFRVGVTIGIALK